MSLNPANVAKPKKNHPPVGLQAARCFAIIDLGIQTGTFKGVPKDPAPEVMLCFELTKFMHKYGEDKPAVPATIMQKYTFSNGKKAKLPKVLKAWGNLTKDIEVLNLKPYLGQYCMINIEHSEDGEYANISGGGIGVNAFMKELPKPAKHYEDIWFDLDTFSWDLFNKLPKYAQTLIQKSGQWASIVQKNGSAPVSQGNTSPVDSIDNSQAEVVTAQDNDVPSF